MGPRWLCISQYSTGHACKQAGDRWRHVCIFPNIRKVHGAKQGTSPTGHDLFHEKYLLFFPALIHEKIRGERFTALRHLGAHGENITQHRPGTRIRHRQNPLGLAARRS